jgi:WD repeat-containing protein 35
MAVDSFLYFANVKPDYHWGYFDSTVCYSFQTPDCIDTSLMFWNPKTGYLKIKTVKQFLFLATHGKYCLTISKFPEDSTRALLTIFNAIGAQCETKTIGFIPKHATLNKSSVVVANDTLILQWQFRVTSNIKFSALDSLRKKDSKGDKYFHVDDIQLDEKENSLQELLLRQSTSDPISSIAISDSVLLVGRQSGSVAHVTLPILQFETMYYLPISSFFLQINADSTRFSVLDKNGTLRLHDLNTKTHSGKMLEIERKDVWDLKWALDNPQMLAISEKTRTFVINGVEVEEPQPANGCKKLFT